MHKMILPDEISKQQLETIERWAELTAAYRQGLLSADAQAELENLLQTHTDFKNWFAQLNGEETTAELLKKYDRFMNSTGAAIEQFAREAQPVQIHSGSVLRAAWLKYAAAVVLICAGIAIYLYTSRKEPHAPVISSNRQDVLPGGDKAVLTLADGSKIILDNAASGNLASQGGAQVIKLDNGQVVYKVRDLSSEQVMWNTMSTPAGGQYQVVLPDGTKVWLNASSSITFPTAFTGGKRQVTVRGEAYFEVTANRKQPFTVDVDGNSTVQVLGTRFNINSYINEGSVITTLLDGSINVVKADRNAILKPGQQAIIAGPAAQGSQNASGIIVRSDANVEQALAWKNGLFDFNGLDLKAVMRQLERWYDIKVQYQGTVDGGIFRGKIYRNVKLSDVLDILQKISGVKFRIEGKTLIVMT